MTIDEAYEYIDHAHEAESEQRAEYGMGAVSLGYDPYEWASDYGGYRTSDDPEFARAQRIIDAYRAERALVAVVRWEPPTGSRPAPLDDDIPF